MCFNILSVFKKKICAYVAKLMKQSLQTLSSKSSYDISAKEMSYNPYLAPMGLEEDKDKDKNDEDEGD